MLVYSEQKLERFCFIERITAALGNVSKRHEGKVSREVNSSCVGKGPEGSNPKSGTGMK
jgi:hypothetical protein